MLDVHGASVEKQATDPRPSEWLLEALTELPPQPPQALLPRLRRRGCRIARQAWHGGSARVALIIFLAALVVTCVLVASAYALPLPV